MPISEYNQRLSIDGFRVAGVSIKLGVMCLGLVIDSDLPKFAVLLEASRLNQLPDKGNYRLCFPREFNLALCEDWAEP